MSISGSSGETADERGDEATLNAIVFPSPVGPWEWRAWLPEPADIGITHPEFDLLAVTYPWPECTDAETDEDVDEGTGPG